MTQILTMPKTGIIQVAQLFKTVVTFIKNVNHSYEQARLAANTIKELNMLTNKELADIGLCRGDIHSVAYQSMSDYTDKINTSDGSNQNLKGWV